MKQEVKEEDGFETRSILCMPIVNGQKSVIGVAQLINKVGASALPFILEKNHQTASEETVCKLPARLISFLLADEWHAIHRL
jgi:hypothetical protein